MRFRACGRRRSSSSPISFVIVNNQRYEALIGFSRHFDLDQPVGTTLPGLDFKGIAEAQGLGAIRVDTADALDAALAASFASAEPNLVEVMVA